MKKYDIIYIDPPWEYNNKRPGKNGSAGVASKYKLMTMEDIKKLELPLKNNAVVFLWATTPLLPDIFNLITHWNLKYKTLLVWDKINTGMGYWFRTQTEFLIVATKGKVPPFKLPIKNIHSEKSQRHSRKPGHFRKIIELLPYKDKLEMFARRGRTEGWDLFGNEAENSIKLK